VGLLVVGLSSLGLIEVIGLTVGVSIMNLAIGTAIPAMTASAMQIAGQIYANSAAAALNANRQVGALVGVAVVGSILHVVNTWSRSTPIAFAMVALTYGIALFTVHRSLRSLR
jgi:DHA2 family methylenomycin A resistance protein-like MFS transporter